MSADCWCVSSVQKTWHSKLTQNDNVFLDQVSTVASYLEPSSCENAWNQGECNIAAYVYIVPELLCIDYLRGTDSKLLL